MDPAIPAGRIGIAMPPGLSVPEGNDAHMIDRFKEKQ